jgi:hypothetical protein
VSLTRRHRPDSAAVGTQTALYAVGAIIVLATLAVLLSHDVRTITRTSQATQPHAVAATDLAQALIKAE